MDCTIHNEALGKFLEISIPISCLGYVIEVGFPLQTDVFIIFQCAINVLTFTILPLYKSMKSRNWNAFTLFRTLLPITAIYFSSTYASMLFLYLILVSIVHLYFLRLKPSSRSLGSWLSLFGILFFIGIVLDLSQLSFKENILPSLDPSSFLLLNIWERCGRMEYLYTTFSILYLLDWHMNEKSLSYQACALGVSGFSTVLFKSVLRRWRPAFTTFIFELDITWPWVEPRTIGAFSRANWSFPSGHVSTLTCSILLYTYNALHCSKIHSNAQKYYAIMTIFILGVGLQRILGMAHWTSDVIISLGIGILTNDILYFQISSTHLVSKHSTV